MSEQEMCLKVSCQGMLRYIHCRPNSKLGSIIPLVIRCFCLPINFAPVIQFTHKSGYVFDEVVFNNFVLLHPRPKVIFYVRLDYIKLAALSSNLPDTDAEDDFEISPSRPNPRNKRTFENKYDSDYATPVFRQNCFWGAYPDSCTALQRRPEAALTKRKHLRTSPKPKKMQPQRKRLLRL